MELPASGRKIAQGGFAVAVAGVSDDLLNPRNLGKNGSEGLPQRGATGARIGWDAAADGGGGQRAEAEVDFCGHMPTKINA